MTEVLLLLVAILLSLACGAFVAAEFSLTTVDRGELERAAERGERGAAGALKAVRNLTFQLSGAQLGITVTNLVVGMLAEPSIAKLIAGPIEALGLSRSTASSLALVLGTALSTVFLMVVGELVPKNWAISSPLAMAKRVGNAQRWFSAAFRPFITHLNNTANHAVRRLGLEPTEELASARSPKELAALARHSAKEGALEADTAELFVRTLNLADLTAENVMTPRVQVIALEARATCEDVANATRATGLSRFPVYRGGLDSVVGTAHIKDVLVIPAERRTRVPVSEVMRDPLLVPETLTVDRSWTGCPAGAPWPSSSTSTAAPRAWPPWRTSSRRSSARCGTSTTRTRLPTWPRQAATTRAAPCTRPTARPASTSSRAWVCGRPRGRTRRWPVWSRPNSAGFRPSATPWTSSDGGWTWWTPPGAGPRGC